MNVKIQATAKELRPLRGSQDHETLYTGVKINGKWFDLKGDHRNLYNKVVDLEINGNMAKFATPQTPPAPAQQPPAPKPPTNGHTPKWGTRNDALDAYLFYSTQLEPYIKDSLAIVRATNCLMMMEKEGEINPVHRKSGGAS